MKYAISAVVLYCCCSAGFGAPIKADLECRPAGAGPVYDCMIRLSDSKSRAPVSDAAFTVSADMPSMPMTHNLRPVPALPQRAAGVYRARLALEMYGKWNVKLRISSPMQDQITKAYDFFEAP
jgi:hypothetical protein